MGEGHLLYSDSNANLIQKHPEIIDLDTGQVDT